MPKGRVPPVPYRKFFRQVAIGQAVVSIGLSPLLPLTAVAQPVAQAPAATTPGSSTSSTPTLTTPANNSNIILPTDVLPLTAGQDKIPFGENMLLRINQYLPSRFYFSSSVETSLRFETNPFQFPKKDILVRQLPAPATIQRLSFNQQLALTKVVQHSDTQDTVFRILPNVNMGWTLTPRTRLFGNYFMIRDQLAKNVTLNTIIHSYAWGVQQDIPLASRANLQAEIQFRELNQWHQQSVFDFLPGLTLSFIANPKTVLFANALLQMRGKKYFQAPTKEIDPFYTVGALHTRGGWTFAASTTMVQNFREPFRHHATIPVNNYAIISDFEIARRLFRQIPGLQGFVRAEPIFNFHSHNRPGLAGIDFRLFYGLRMAVAKPALTATMNNIIEQLRNQEKEPQAPGTKPSAMLPDNVIAGLQMPIHGSVDGEGGEEEPMEVTPATSVDAAAATIASAESSTGETTDSATPVAAAEPIDMQKADWKPIVADLPDEKDFTLEEIHEQLNSGAAESTVVGYDSTLKRADAIATRPVVAPKVELTKANWNNIIAAANAVPPSVHRTDDLAAKIEEDAAQSSMLAYADTAKRDDKLVAKAPHVVAPQPVVIAHEHEQNLQRFEAKPVVAQKPASPQIAAVAHEAAGPRRGGDERLRESRPIIEIAHETESVSMRFKHKAAPPPVIAHETESVIARFDHKAAPPPVIAHETESVIARFDHTAAPPPVIAHETESVIARFDHKAAPPPVIAHESASIIDRFDHKDPAAPVVAHESESRFAHFDAKPVAPSIDIAKADWNSFTLTASQIKTNDTVLDSGSLIDTISSAQSQSTTFGAADTAHRMTELAHAAPPAQPAPRQPEFATAVAPKPISTASNTPALPAGPTPSHISAGSSAVPTPHSLAAAISPVPMTPTAALPSGIPMSKPLSAAASRPALAPASPVASIPQTPQPMAAPVVHSAALVAPSLMVGRASAAGGPAAPAPAVISTGASDSVPVPVVIATVPAVAPHSVPPAPIPAKEEAPHAVLPDVVAVLPPLAAPKEKQIDLLASANWDSFAQLGMRRTVPNMQYLGDLRASIDQAANDSARVLDYTVLNGRDRTKAIAARTPKPPSQQPAPPAHPVMFVPMHSDLTPQSITTDRPGEQNADGSFAVTRPEDPTQSHGWHTAPTHSAHESSTTMRIIPPLPTVRVRGKENPFKGTGIDLKVPLMLSLPH